MTNIKKEEEYIYSSQPDEPLLQENTQIPSFTSQLIYAFLKKTHGTNLQFFLTFF